MLGMKPWLGGLTEGTNHLRIGKKGDEFPTGWGLLRGALFVSTGPLRGQVFSIKPRGIPV